MRSAFAEGGVPAGEILWRARLSQDPWSFGNLATPVIDRSRGCIYIASTEVGGPCNIYALELGSGRAVDRWPVGIGAATVNQPGINRNGTMPFPDKPLIQRGALTLSPNGGRLYVSFACEGAGASSGWLVAIDTADAKVATAFSATARAEEQQGGMWSSSGASVDADGFIHIATGASVVVPMKKLGLPGIFPDSEHNWGQSILRLRDDRQKGFELVGTYTPFNYAQTQVMDIDLSSSGTIVVDLVPRRPARRACSCRAAQSKAMCICSIARGCRARS